MPNPGPLDDRFAFWVRFTCGALLGALIAFRWILYSLFHISTALMLGTVSLMLLCGFAAAKLRDGFWEQTLVLIRRWSFWWWY
jgi:hypothetical protein